MAIATADWGSQAGSGLQAIQIKGTANSTSKAATLMGNTACKKEATGAGAGCHLIDNLPVILSQAAAECQNTSDGGNEIRWDYY